MFTEEKVVFPAGVLKSLVQLHSLLNSCVVNKTRTDNDRIKGNKRTLR